MLEQNQEFQLLVAFISVILVAQGVNLIHQYIINRNTGKVLASIVPTDEMKKYETWWTHFESKLAQGNPLGFKALANPWDDSEPGIPNREELGVLQQMLAAKGFTSHINRSIEFPHLTICWN